MPNYKGIPLDGGLDSPTGAGAANIVLALKSIIDFLVNCNFPGVLRDAGDVDAIQWVGRFLCDTAGNQTLNFSAGRTIVPGTSDTTIDWAIKVLYSTGNQTAIRWESRELIEADGGTVALDWSNGVTLANLPTSDPGVVGRLWNNAGVVNVSI